MKAFTTEQLIASTRRRASLTTDVGSEGTEDPDFIDVLDEVFLEELVPQMRKYQEGYFLRTTTLTVSSTGAYYKIPKRAIGNTLEDVYWQRGEQSRYLPLIGRGNLPFYSRDRVVGAPTGFLMEGDRIRLVPPASAGELVVSFSIRGGQYVKSDQYRQVIDLPAANEVQLDSAVPTTWEGATTLTFDAHSKDSGAEIRMYGVGVTTITGDQIIFSQDIDGTVEGTFAVEIGDYILEEGNAAVPSLPREAHPVLCQAAALRFLEADGDNPGLKAARETYSRMMKNFDHLFETRVARKAQKLTNRRSFLHAHRRRKGGW